MEHVTGLLPFWDEHLIDTRYTDATLSVNPLLRREAVMTFDKPWEGNSTNFFDIVRDGDVYRMYYLGWSYTDKPLAINVCYAESRDGIHWDRPSLGICEYEGSTDNNILIKGIHDNFTVMKDPNPSCPPEMRYKALMMVHNEKMRALQTMISADGFHFTPHSIISEGYHYDTQNTLLWDRHTGKYFCYIRDVHRAPCAEDSRCNEHDVRGIRVSESEDFVHWTEPVLLSFGGAEDYPLYTNCVSPYPYDDRYYIGFPSRYVERRSWTKNYDRLCGAEARRERSKLSMRYGLVVTDCVFMSSRDRYHWHRFDEAILTPGPENGENWVYGDCYPAAGDVLVLPSAYENEPDELSLYVYDKHWMEAPTNLIRYTSRRDGFASVKAPYKPKTLKTKCFTFEGSSLLLNFRTSARGGITLRILDEYSHPIEGYTTCEMFGDSVERIVDFEKPLAELQGKKVIFEFAMSDAELFSMKFN